MEHYSIAPKAITAPHEGVLLTVGFAAPAGNDTLVREAAADLESLGLNGGRLCLVNGPASLPVGAVITHGVAHLYEVVAMFDPKLGSYVVAVSHGGDLTVGDLIPAADVR